MEILTHIDFFLCISIFFTLFCLLDRHPQLSTELTSQSATDNEEEEGEDKADQSQAAGAASANTLRPLDPTLLEALSLVANANLAEEEEALGKVCHEMCNAKSKYILFKF